MITSKTNPAVSIVVPIHATMEHGDYFLWRLIQSVMSQTFKDYEIIITQDGSMPVNSNAGIKKARGEIIKILYLDDYLAHPDSLKNIVDAFSPKTQWLVTGCLHQKNEGDPEGPHYPQWNDELYTGKNSIGSPSVLSFRNEAHLLFDESLTWLLDCDLYKRYYDQYGPPTILDDLNVVIGTGKHQSTYLISNERKSKEYEYLIKKYT